MVFSIVVFRPKLPAVFAFRTTGAQKLNEVEQRLLEQMSTVKGAEVSGANNLTGQLGGTQSEDVMLATVLLRPKSRYVLGRPGKPVGAICISPVP